MRNLFLAAAVLASVCPLPSCQPEKMSTLADVSKPYLGVYECEKLRLGELNVLKDFEYLRISLGYGGACALSYRTASGREEELFGTYVADMVRPEITFTYSANQNSVAKTYRLEDGAIYVRENLGGVLLYGEFRR